MDANESQFSKDLKTFRLQWKVLSFYERFEQIMAHGLALIICLVIFLSFLQLLKSVATVLFINPLLEMDHKFFQTIFGMVMTLLIAMEFKHSITPVMVRHNHFVQVKTVILIALMAVARKFIVLDLGLDPAELAALAIALIALGGVYWLMRQRDDPIDAQGESHQRGGPAPLKDRTQHPTNNGE